MTAAPPRDNYAMSHDVVRMSAKRFAKSPWMDAYLNENALLGVYSGRFYALGTTADPEADYWHLRRGAGLFDVPERPIEIVGADAFRLLDRLFCRDISRLRSGRATYAIACDQTGGVLMDGVVMRLAENRFWYVLADGEFLSWMKAHALGMEVMVRDPGSWVIQVQGPKSLELLPDLLDGAPPEPFRYFSVHETVIGGQPFLLSRTGWTGEMGFELYTLASDFDGPALFHLMLERGKRHGLAFSSLESMGIRRIEAGIRDNGTDMNPSMTPFEAGLGAFVDLEKETDFIGKAALAAAPRGSRFFGLLCRDAAPMAGSRIVVDGRDAGVTTTGAFSPYLESGIAFARLDEAGDWAGREAVAVLADGSRHRASIIDLPFYDPDKLIPRGLANDIP